MFKLSSLVALVVVLCAGGLAAAQEPEWRKHNDEGLRAYAEKRYADAEKSFQAAVKAAEKLGKEHLPLAEALTNLSGTHFRRLKYGDAAKTLERALRIREAVLGAEHLDVARTLEDLAEIYFKRAGGGYILVETIGPMGFVRIPLDGAVGVGYFVEGRTTFSSQVPNTHFYRSFSESVNALKRALAIREKKLAETDPDVVRTLSKLARVYFEEQKFKEAAPVLERVAAAKEKSRGAAHPEFAGSLTELGYAHFLAGNHAEAETALKRALAIYDAMPKADAVSKATSLFFLAEVYRAQARYAEAEALYPHALALLEKARGRDHPDLLGTLQGYAALLRKTGRQAQAKQLEDRAQAILTAVQREREEAFHRKKPKEK